MKRRTFLHTIGLTGLSLSSAGLVTGCKSFATKTTAIKKNLYQAEFVNTLIKDVRGASSKGGYLKVEKAAFDFNGALAIAHKNNVIGLIKLNDKNFAASLLMCPHQGCGVEFMAETAQQKNSYVCPCHGARFNETGKVTKGPATQNLTTFITHTDQQFVYIHLVS